MSMLLLFTFTDLLNVYAIRGIFAKLDLFAIFDIINIFSIPDILDVFSILDILHLFAILGTIVTHASFLS